MCSAFSRCIELLDFRQKKEDKIQKQKEEAKSKIESMDKDELARLLELLSNGKNSGSSMQIQQRTSSGKGWKLVGNPANEKVVVKKVSLP